MLRTRIRCLSVAGLGLALLTAACGGSADVTGGSEPVSTSPPVAAGNAIVQGTVLDGVEGMRVSVVGGTSTALTDEEGQFALQGVPAGTVTLRFQGAGVDAPLTVPDVQDGKVTTIKVSVAGSTARMSTAALSMGWAPTTPTPMRSSRNGRMLPSL